MSARHGNLARLGEQYEVPVGELLPTDRYAAVWREAYGEDDGPAGIAVAPTEQEAFGHLEDAILQGAAGLAVFDLDSGDLIEIHVSVHVTRSEQQGVTANPLRETHGWLGHQDREAR